MIKSFITGGLVCVDCYTVLSTGDTSGMAEWEAEAWADRVESYDATDGGRYVVVPGGGEDGDNAGFGWSDCDYCGSGLGGDRFDVTFIEEE